MAKKKEIKDIPRPPMPNDGGKYVLILTDDQEFIWIPERPVIYSWHRYYHKNEEKGYEGYYSREVLAINQYTKFSKLSNAFLTATDYFRKVDGAKYDKKVERATTGWKKERFRLIGNGLWWTFIIVSIHQFISFWWLRECEQYFGPYAAGFDVLMCGMVCLKAYTKMHKFGDGHPIAYNPFKEWDIGILYPIGIALILYPIKIALIFFAAVAQGFLGGIGTFICWLICLSIYNYDQEQL